MQIVENAVISNYSNHITTRQKLFGNYYYEFCRFDLLQTFVLDNYQRVFFDGLSPFDKNQTVKKTKFNLLIYHIDTPIGWSFGKQLNDIEFYMINTGIFSEHQNKGIYSNLLPIILNNLKELDFKFVHSRHNTDNQRIITLKQKFGFKIVGIDNDERFGLMIKLKKEL